MHHSIYFLIPFALAATRDLAIGVAPSRVKRSMISPETEYRVLSPVAIALTVLLIGSSLMTTHPELGALIANYNQF